jgi:hypothetical protein
VACANIGASVGTWVCVTYAVDVGLCLGVYKALEKEPIPSRHVDKAEPSTRFGAERTSPCGSTVSGALTD